jgi:hypothetical protein
MKKALSVVLVLLFAGVASVTLADDKSDINGKWKWSAGGGGGKGQAREQTVELKLEGDKLTGSLLGRNDQKTPIEDASFKDGEVSFKVTRQRMGQKLTITYNGKLSGDTIKGKIDRGMGEPVDWEAKRVK